MTFVGKGSTDLTPYFAFVPHRVPQVGELRNGRKPVVPRDGRGSPTEAGGRSRDHRDVQHNLLKHLKSQNLKVPASTCQEYLEKIC